MSKQKAMQSARRPSFRPFPDRLMTMIPSYVFPNKGHGPTRNLCSKSYWPLGLGSWSIVVNHAPDLQRIHAWCILCEGKKLVRSAMRVHASQQAASKEWPIDQQWSCSAEYKSWATVVGLRLLLFSPRSHHIHLWSILFQSGHKKPRTENRTKLTGTKTEIFGPRFQEPKLLRLIRFEHSVNRINLKWPNYVKAPRMQAWILLYA